MKSPVDRFLVWWLRTGRYAWSSARRRLWEGRYLSTLLPAAGSLEEIERHLEQVTWTMDGPLHLFDSISYPQVTWATKKDDCDGFAVLAAELLRRWDQRCEPVLLTVMVHPVRASHTVCAFTSRGGGFQCVDNGSLHPREYRTYAEVVTEITKGATRLVCWDVRHPVTLEMIEFHQA